MSTERRAAKEHIENDDRIIGEHVYLRLVTLADCTEQYLAWLNDPEVSRYLETRWTPQSMETIREFVRAMSHDPASYLFAIVESATDRHVGNLKVGPINPRHRFADVSYFIGAREVWGKGYAAEAIRLATQFGFERLGLHRLQAGLYGTNLASARALEKAGFTIEGRSRRKFKTDSGWEDHLVYGATQDDWRNGSPLCMRKRSQVSP